MSSRESWFRSALPKKNRQRMSPPCIFSFGFSLHGHKRSACQANSTSGHGTEEYTAVAGAFQKSLNLAGERAVSLRRSLYHSSAQPRPHIHPHQVKEEDQIQHPLHRAGSLLLLEE